MRGLGGALLGSQKVRMVEAVLHEPEFRIGVELLANIRTSAAHIMLNGEHLSPCTRFDAVARIRS